ncbi:MAG: hypothetical protein QJR03_02335 [Sphaerobacter sp.]|nr:hypothetical protein [Sphaerobacter sp.]
MCEQRQDRLDDAMLSRVLGTATLPEAIRQRHLRQLARHHAARARYGAALAAPGMRARAVAALVVALVATMAVVAALGSQPWPSPESPAVAVAERLLIPPAPGRGRHIVVEAEVQIPITARPRRSITEVWQRTLPDGTEQMALRAQLALAKPENVAEARQGTTHVITADITDGFSPIERAALEDALGARATAITLELTIDTARDRLLRWQVMVHDARRAAHPMYRLAFTTWEETTAAAIDDAHFAEPGTSDLPPAAGSLPPVPSVIDLPIGRLTVSSRESAGAGRAQVILVGPQSLVLTVDIAPLGGSLHLPGSGVHPFAGPGFRGFWQQDPRQGWPRIALWEDQRRRYALSVNSAAPPGWSEADVIALARAFADQAGTTPTGAPPGTATRAAARARRGYRRSSRRLAPRI